MLFLVFFAIVVFLFASFQIDKENRRRKIEDEIRKANARTLAKNELDLFKLQNAKLINITSMLNSIKTSDEAKRMSYSKLTDENFDLSTLSLKFNESYNDKYGFKIWHLKAEISELETWRLNYMKLGEINQDIFAKYAVKYFEISKVKDFGFYEFGKTIKRKTTGSIIANFIAYDGFTTLYKEAETVKNIYLRKYIGHFSYSENEQEKKSKIDGITTNQLNIAKTKEFENKKKEYVEALNKLGLVIGLCKQEMQNKNNSKVKNFNDLSQFKNNPPYSRYKTCPDCGAWHNPKYNRCAVCNNFNAKNDKR